MADAQAQAMKSVVVAQLGNGVAKSVVPTVTTAFLAANHAGGQVELVMGDQDLLGGDAIEAGQRGNRLTAAVHVGGGDKQTRSEEHTSELQSRPHLVCR